jgi:hypothetical protein
MIVARAGNLPVLQYLHSVLCARDEWTCANAALQGRLDVLQWARQNECPCDATTCTEAAANGHLAVLQWAHAKWLSVGYAYLLSGGTKCAFERCPWDWMSGATAADKGHLHVLKWLRGKGRPWKMDLCTIAAGSGHLDTC